MKDLLLYRSQRAKGSSQTSALAPVWPGTSILQVPNTTSPHIIAKLEMHHKTVTLWRHFLPHKKGKQREALLSQTAATAGGVRSVA